MKSKSLLLEVLDLWKPMKKVSNSNLGCDPVKEDSTFYVLKTLCLYTYISDSVELQKNA